MELILGVVADAANKAVGDKLNILGVFHTIGAAQFPVTHPHLALALEFRAAPYEKGRSFRIEINLRDPDGKAMFDMQGDLQLAPEAPVLRPIVPMDINIHNLVFPSPGDYRFEISVNGDLVGEVPLEILRISPQNQPPV